MTDENVWGRIENEYDRKRDHGELAQASGPSQYPPL